MHVAHAYPVNLLPYRTLRQVDRNNLVPSLYPRLRVLASDPPTPSALALELDIGRRAWLSPMCITTSYALTPQRVRFFFVCQPASAFYVRLQQVTISCLSRGN